MSATLNIKALEELASSRPDYYKSRRRLTALAFLSNIPLSKDRSRQTSYLNLSLHLRECISGRTSFGSEPTASSLLQSDEHPAQQGIDMKEPTSTKNSLPSSRCPELRLADEPVQSRSPVPRTVKFKSEVKCAVYDSDEVTPLNYRLIRSFSETTSRKERAMCRNTMLIPVGADFIHALPAKPLKQKRVLMINTGSGDLVVSFSVLPYQRQKGSFRPDNSKSIAGFISSLPGSTGDEVQVNETDKMLSYATLLFGPSASGLTDESESFRDILSGLAYDTYTLDDPRLTTGKHRAVLALPSIVMSFLEYVDQENLKRDLNALFRQKHPAVNITLTKLRSLKAEIGKIADKASLEASALAAAMVYFEKVTLMGKVNKTTRKLFAGSSLLLAAKFYDDMTKEEIMNLIKVIENCFRIGGNELLSYEFCLLVCLEFTLLLPRHEILPMCKRIGLTGI